MTALMNRAEYAAHRGVVPTAVTKWKNKGLIVMAPGDDGKPKIDVAASDVRVKAYTDVTTGRPRKVEYASVAAKPVPTPQLPNVPDDDEPAKMSPMEEARLRSLQARIVKQEIENAQTIGDLVPLSEYTQRAGDMARLIRERSHTIFRQVSERLSAETDPRRVTAILVEAFDQMLNHVAEEIDQAATDEAVADRELSQAEVQEELDLEE